MFMVIRNDCYIYFYFQSFPSFLLCSSFMKFPHSCLSVIQILYIPYFTGLVPFPVTFCIHMLSVISVNFSSFGIIFRLLLQGMFVLFSLVAKINTALCIGQQLSHGYRFT